MRIVSVSAVLFVLGCVSTPSEDAPTDGRQVQSIVRNTASPFCPGKTLDSCPSPKAGEWRRDIHEWVAEGVPEPEIQHRLQARVPGFDLSIPPVKSGWVIPSIAVVLSTWWLVVMARSFRRRGVPKPVEPAIHDHTLDARLDEELAGLD
ncbi:MAG: cytochrome c-type biogenesis protein CcmH [Deltaproteobacteria bacterium]|nr:cytochrome c-type biogenesis protein CcmH [Deltaproteobacteria bacterium]MBW2717412.1 cytochrome c-type biogenesis protein CcmH [Deltaproteobacteria bacterium]